MMRALFLLLFSTSVFSAPVMLQPLQGNPIPFQSLKGQWVMINYWASWCEACLEEIPELNAFYQMPQQKPFALFAVNYEALSPQEQIVLATQFHLKYPSLSQDPGPQLQLDEISVLPVTFVFDPNGRLHDTLYGKLTATRLQHYLSSASLHEAA